MLMPRSRRTHALVVIAGFAAAALVTLIIAVASPVLRSLSTTEAAPEDAERALAGARARFRGQTPLIEVSFAGTVPTMTVHLPPESQPFQRLDHLVVLAYDPGTKRLVRTMVPLWAVRFGQWRNVVLRAVGRADLQITVADIERHGPGLIADIRGASGRHAVLWAE
jgi:hypothetical protein